MKRKSVRTLISLLLVLSLSFSVLAVSPSSLTDIAGHWAESDIRYCVSEGLFNGYTDGRFGPNDPMSRGMFVTVLGIVILNFWEETKK